MEGERQWWRNLVKGYEDAPGRKPENRFRYERDRVEVAGLPILRHGEAFDDEMTPFWVRAVVENTPSGPRVVDLRVRARPDGPPITPAALRLIKFSKLVDASVTTGGYRQALRKAPRRERRWLLDEARLADVARVYREAVATGEPPVLAVQNHYGIKSRGTASRWVRRARAEGLLAPAPGRGRKGETEGQEGETDG
jgi:hypothetical protein